MRIRKKEHSLKGIKQERPGLFRIRVKVRDEKTGRVIDTARLVECKTLEEAARQRVAIREGLANAKPRQGRVRLTDYAEQWLKVRADRLKTSTKDRYARELGHICHDLGDTYLDEVTQEQLQEWIASVQPRWKPHSINGMIRVLKTMLADAVHQYGLPRNPAERIHMLSTVDLATLEGGPPNILGPQEVEGLMSYLKDCQPQWFAMIFTAFATARRWGEVTALRWEDIDDGLGVIHIRRAHWHGKIDTPKTDALVTAPLTAELRDVLIAWRQRLIRMQHRHLASGWIFPSAKGKPHHNSSCVRPHIIEGLRRIGVDRRFTAHGLRRTANNLLRQVASGIVTRAITGHMDEAMTRHYSHVDEGEKRTASEGMLRVVRDAAKVGSRVGTGGGFRWDPTVAASAEAIG